MNIDIIKEFEDLVQTWGSIEEDLDAHETARP